MTGPATAPEPATVENILIVFSLSVPAGSICTRMATGSESSAAPPRPCSPRSTMSMGAFVDSAQPSVASTNSHVVNVSTRLRP